MDLAPGDVLTTLIAAYMLWRFFLGAEPVIEIEDDEIEDDDEIAWDFDDPRAVMKQARQLVEAEIGDHYSVRITLYPPD